MTTVTKYMVSKDTETQSLTQDMVNFILASQAASVKFTKIDGTVREMNATLSPAIVPPTVVVEGRAERKVNPDVRTVYDVDAKAWKSFRWDSLISITFEDTV